MGNYEINLAKSAVKEIESLDNPILNKILKKIEALSQNPRPSGCIKLRGSNDLWRIRVNDYRILYSITDKDHQIDIIAVKHRKEAYS